MRIFDVVGAGPGGEVAAGRLAEAGLDVAIVEADKAGGECSYYACMPSKARLRPGEVLATARRTPGVVAGQLDVAAVLRRRHELIGGLDDAGQLPWLEERGVHLVRGWGRLAGERRVAVGDEILQARRAVILAGGTRSALPPIDGLAAARPWTNREAATATTIPASLIVIGGGVVGVEMTGAYRSLGARVTLIEGDRGLLPREEDFVREQLRAALREQGADLREERAVGVRREDGVVTVTLSGGGTVTADEVLVAAGRTPQTAGLGLETAGIDAGGFVTVDERMRAPGHDWLYVVGDLNGRALFTHMAKYQAAIAIVGEVPLARLRHAIPAFPTRSEIWLRLFDALGR
ncbi:FAD-dependent oxidoreductase [Actinoplanes philippinensis]|uniref:FAD-dependent oxidoreductase n=1 Tax=Actinoplanes philippinensis TaxID=35752 RepID=UPI0033DAB755